MFYSIFAEEHLHANQKSLSYLSFSILTLHSTIQDHENDKYLHLTLKLFEKSTSYKKKSYINDYHLQQVLQ